MLIAEIDKKEWPETWERILGLVKNPETHSESAWLESISEKCDRADHPDTYFEYEIRSHFTRDGNPALVAIDVVWVEYQE